MEEREEDEEQEGDEGGEGCRRHRRLDAVPENPGGEATEKEEGEVVDEHPLSKKDEEAIWRITAAARVRMNMPMDNEEKKFLVREFRSTCGSSNAMPKNHQMREFMKEGIKHKRLDKKLEVETVRNFFRAFTKIMQGTPDEAAEEENTEAVNAD